MKKFVCLLFVALLLLPLGCKKESGKSREKNTAAKTVLAKTATVDGIETPNYYAWYYHVQKDGTAMLDRYVCVSTQDALTLPEKVDGYTVTALARNAFRDDVLQGEITIPDCLTEIEGNPFNARTIGYSIAVSASHPTLEIRNGALFDKRESRLICAFAFDKDAIPEGTRIIEDHAFRNARIGEVYIPASVEKIGQNPFGYRQTHQMATLFWKITVAEDNPYFKVHDDALFDEREHRLISVSRADRFERSQNGEDTMHYVVPDGTKKIDDLALEMIWFDSVTIPASVKEIGINPFTGAREIRLASGNPRFTITGGVLYDTVEKRVICREHNNNADPAETVTIPEGTEIIGESAISYANHDLTLPDSVREIGENGLVNIAGYDVNTAPIIRIPKTVRRLGAYAICGYRFENDTLSLNGGVEIGVCAFSNVMGLTDVEIGDGGAIVHGGAFQLISGADSQPLQRISFGTGETVIGKGVFIYCRRLETVNFSEGLALLGKNAFYECRNLLELKLPKSLYWTDPSAFWNASYDEYNPTTDAYIRHEASTIELVVYRDTYAERFAKANDLAYRYAD